MNTCVIGGNLVRDVTLRQAGTSQVANFTIASKGYKDNTDFVPCSAWGKTAEIVSQYGKKGKFIAVQGRFTSRNYEKDGKKIYVYEIKVDSVLYLERTPKAEQLPPDNPPF